MIRNGMTIEQQWNGRRLQRLAQNRRCLRRAQKFSLQLDRAISFNLEAQHDSTSVPEFQSQSLHPPDLPGDRSAREGSSGRRRTSRRLGP